MNRTEGGFALDLDKRYTLAEWRSWPDDERWELINGVHGAPDFVVEVLSDATANKDFGIKLELYETSGVREYWIIQPETATVFQYVLDGNTFAPVREFRRRLPVPSAVFAGFSWVCI
ncbi:MAG: Uma2 family endonuclease [Spirochaetota bacterium]